MPAIIYKNSLGERVPSVTTVLSTLGWNKEALMYWAWDCGMRNINYREQRDDAATIGSLMHAFCEANLKGQPFDLDKIAAPEEHKIKVELMRLGWLEWRDHNLVNITHAETSIVSEEKQYGGTFDAYGLADGKRTLIDIKTSKGVYAEYIVQLSAYAALWDEHHKEEKVDEIMIIHLSKTDGSFKPYSWGRDTIEIGKAAFLGALIAYNTKKKLEEKLNA